MLVALKTSNLTVMSDCLILNRVTVRPPSENTRSDAAEVAENARYFLATLATSGILDPSDSQKFNAYS